VSKRCSIDTNVWLYAFIRSQDGYKNRIASKLISDNLPIVSTQIINEICVNLIKKTSITEGDMQNLIISFYDNYPVIEINRSILLLSSHIREKYKISFWDSQIVAAALSSGCSILYTEDMQNGLIVENSLKIINPFI